jgi:RNA polymerase sigma factor (sigma-70 family)
MGNVKFFDFKKKTQKNKFEAHYEEHYATIVRRIAYLTGDVHVAEELAQEVFIKLLSIPPEHENVIAWLNTVAARTAYNYMRDDRSHREKELSQLQPEKVILSSAEDSAIKNEESRLTQAVLQQMIPRDRICLLMKHSGYKYAEIAECLGLDINAVGTVISRAQKKFKEAYENRYNQGGLS